jgi:hypothetical protein
MQFAPVHCGAPQIQPGLVKEFIEACKLCNFPKMSYFLKNGEYINQTHEGETAVHAVIKEIFTPVPNKSLIDLYLVLKILLRNFADVCVQDSKGNTPLHMLGNSWLFTADMIETRSTILKVLLVQGTMHKETINQVVSIKNSAGQTVFDCFMESFFSRMSWYRCDPLESGKEILLLWKSVTEEERDIFRRSWKSNCERLFEKYGKEVVFDPDTLAKTLTHNDRAIPNGWF